MLSACVCMYSVDPSTLCLDIYIVPFKDCLNILRTSMCCLLLPRTHGSLKSLVAVILDQCKTLPGTTLENIWCRSALIKLVVSMDTGLLKMKLRQVASCFQLFLMKIISLVLLTLCFFEWILCE